MNGQGTPGNLYSVHDARRFTPVLTHVLEVDPADVKATAHAVLAAWQEAPVVLLRPNRVLTDVRATYEQLLPAIGTPYHLAEDVRQGERELQRTGDLWFEVRFDPAFPDAYRHSANGQPLHTDGSYIPTYPNATLMCCVTNAQEGGETTFITAEHLVEVLGREAPALLHALQTTVMPHARSGDRRSHTVIRRESDEFRLNWNYYCVDRELPPSVLELREEFFAFLRDSPGVAQALVGLKLQAGEAVVWKDERVLHGRNAFIGTTRSNRFLWKCAIDVGVFGAST